MSARETAPGPPGGVPPQKPDDNSPGAAPAKAPSIRRNSIVVSLILVLDVLATIAVAILLAHTLGAAGLGLYAIGIAAGRMPVPLIQFGLPVLLTREVNHGRATGDAPHVRGVLIFAAGVVLSFSAVFVALTWLVWPAVLAWTPENLRDAVSIGLIITPIAAITAVCGGCLQGWQKIPTAAATTSLGPNSAVLIALIWAVVFAPDWLTPERAIAINIAANALIMVLALFLVARLAWPELTGVKAIYEIRKWFASTTRLALAGGLTIFEQHGLILIVGTMAGESEAAYLRIARRGAGVANLGYSAVMRTITPGLSASHATQNRDRMQRLVTKAARAVSLTTLAVLIGVAVAGQWLIALAFGAEFLPAYLPMVLFCAAMAVRAFFGPADAVLSMTHNEDAILKGQVVGLGLSITLSLVLASAYGALGAAAAAAIGTLLLSLILWRAADRRLGCATTAIGRMRG